MNKGKKHSLLLFTLLFLFAFLLTLSGCDNSKGGITNMTKKNDLTSEIRTDSEPIYNHFPSFPNSEHIEWCSTSSTGIGLVTHNVFLFAFWDDSTEIDAFLENRSLSADYCKIETPFIPECIDGLDMKWQKVLDASFCFQEGSSSIKRMGTEVYIDTVHNTIYMHAIGD